MQALLQAFQNLSITTDSMITKFALIFIGAAVLSTVFLYLRQPIIFAYIILGMIIGPSGLALIENVQNIEQISQLGIIFLMFLVGINLHPQKLFVSFKSTAPIVLISSLVFIIVFSAVSMVLRVSLVENIIVGISLMFSSTIIGIKLLPTSTLHQKHVGERMISILLLQDFLAIVALLVILNETHIGNRYILSIVLLLLKMLLLIALSYVFVKYILLTMLRKFSVIQDYMFLLSLGWCLLATQAAHTLGMPYEVGAFTAGFVLASSPISLAISEGMKPIREFFLILFFFSMGARFDIFTIYNVMVPALLLTAIVIVLKIFVFRIILLKFGERKKDAVDLGLRLGQASEFSLHMVSGAVVLQRLQADMSTLVQIVTLFTFIISTYIVVGFCSTPIAVDIKHRKD